MNIKQYPCNIQCRIVGFTNNKNTEYDFNFFKHERGIISKQFLKTITISGSGFQPPHRRKKFQSQMTLYKDIEKKNISCGCEKFFIYIYNNIINN